MSTVRGLPRELELLRGVRGALVAEHAARGHRVRRRGAAEGAGAHSAVRRSRRTPMDRLARRRGGHGARRGRKLGGDSQSRAGDAE